jgi:hypothetical protein
MHRGMDDQMDRFREEILGPRSTEARTALKLILAAKGRPKVDSVIGNLIPLHRAELKQLLLATAAIVDEPDENDISLDSA